MTRIVGMSGSLRTGSLNSALLRAAAGSAPVGVGIQIASIHGIPLNNEDLERTEFPVTVTAIKKMLADRSICIEPWTSTETLLTPC